MCGGWIVTNDVYGHILGVGRPLIYERDPGPSEPLHLCAGALWLPHGELVEAVRHHLRPIGQPAVLTTLLPSYPGVSVQTTALRTSVVAPHVDRGSPLRTAADHLAGIQLALGLARRVGAN